MLKKYRIKKYRTLAVAIVAAIYGLAALIFPDVVLPSQESIVAIMDTLAETLSGE